MIKAEIDANLLEIDYLHRQLTEAQKKRSELLRKCRHMKCQLSTCVCGDEIYKCYDCNKILGKKKDTYIPMPASITVFNGSHVKCDMFEGPCCCGAWHSYESWAKDVLAAYDEHLEKNEVEEDRGYYHD